MTCVMNYNYHGAPGGNPGGTGGYVHGFGFFPQQNPTSSPDVSSSGAPTDAIDQNESRLFRTNTMSSSVSQSSLSEQTQSGGSGERRRHKLGYHRTSIACSHCRRRKIRCIASPDVQNKCVTCIRLKKECSFYSVDQQTPHEGKAKKPSGSKSSGSASTASPPRLEARQAAESSRKSQEITSVPFNSNVRGSLGDKRPVASGDGGRFKEHATNQIVEPSGQTFAGWMPQEITQSPTSTQTDHPGAWQPYPAGHSIGDPYSPYHQPPNHATGPWPFPQNLQTNPTTAPWGGFAPEPHTNYNMGQPQSIGHFVNPRPGEIGIAMGNLNPGVGSHMNSMYQMTPDTSDEPQVVWRHNVGPASFPESSDAFRGPHV